MLCAIKNNGRVHFFALQTKHSKKVAGSKLPSGDLVAATDDNGAP